MMNKKKNNGEHFHFAPLSWGQCIVTIHLVWCRSTVQLKFFDSRLTATLQSTTINYVVSHAFFHFVYRFSSAALAFENCDEKYRAVFAGNGIFLLFDARWPINNFLEPKPSRSSSSQDGSSSYATDDRSDRQLAPQNSLSNMGLAPELSGSSDCILHVICSPMVHKSLKNLIAISLTPNLVFDR